MKKIRFTLDKKVVLMILLMSVTLCATALFVSYRTYQARSSDFYREIGLNAARSLASQLEADDLDHYYETQEIDEHYYEIQNLIRDLAESNNVLYLYVVRPNGLGVTFLFDSDMELGENGDYYAGGYCALGTYVEVLGGFAENLDKLLVGEEVDPIVSEDPVFGQILTAMTPVCHEDGTMAGYVMVDISMYDVLQERQHFLLYTGILLTVLTLFFAAVYLILIRRSFVLPIQQLTHAAQVYEGGENKAAFSDIKIRSNDELRTLADAFRMMLVEIDLNNTEQKELAVREQQLESELQLANELNSSMLPRELPEREDGYPFGIQGMQCQGGELSCNFYDYFLLDRERLGIVVGEVPGHGIPQVLYTVMAQTAIRSRMRSGLNLAEAMTAVNSQLHEMSSAMSLEAFVGVLDGVTGQFSYINAGQKAPLLLRNQDRYEWMKAPVYAPLGQSENVVYQVQEVELHQGDRMFFHTGGLDELHSETGECFGTGQLQMSLNLSRSQQLELGGLLSYVSEAGSEFSSEGQKEGYSLLALEFSRRNKVMAHCLLSSGGKGSMQLMDFLRGQLEANGIQGRTMAEVMVLADELYTICARQSEEDGRLMAECVMPQGEHMLLLRLKGRMGGVNPLDCPEGETGVHGASFVRRNTDQVFFEHSETMDIITVTKQLAVAEAVESERQI